MEFKILAPLDGQYAQPIEFNFEELKQELTARLEVYNGMVFTDDSISEAKDTRAKLNKFREAIEDKRKEVKRQCMSPYEAFEKKVKELVALVDAPILAIDAQVKSYEQRKRDDKRADIEAYYTANISDLSDLLPFERIFNDKWLNATAKLKDICRSIDMAISLTRADLQTITDLRSEFELQIKDVYLNTLSISAALNEKTRLEQQKAKLAEFEQKKSAAIGDIDEASLPVKSAPVSVQESEQVVELDFRVYATKTQLKALAEFLARNNIKYGRVPQEG